MQRGGFVVACALVATMAACGRFGFESRTDDVIEGDAPLVDVALLECATPTGHDEDKDAVDDGCDNCPHRPNTDQMNDDADGVGDICDPDQTTPENVVYFDPFTSRRPEWEVVFAVEPNWDGERVVVSSTNLTFMHMPWEHGRDVYAIGGRLNGGGGNPRQVALQVRHPTNPASYYCELYDNTPAESFDVSATETPDGAQFNTLDQETLPGRIENHAFSIDLFRDLPTMQCSIPWDGLHELAGTVPPNLAAAQLAMVMSNVEVELEYFVVIRTEL